MSSADDSGPRPIDDLPLFPDNEPEPLTASAEQETSAPDDPQESPPIPEREVVQLPIEGPATLTNRLGAALLDLAVMAASAVTLLAGAALLGARPTVEDWPAFVVPWAIFSLLYHVVPLSFWGRTPGMASMGLTARDLHGGGLSFGQALARWIGTLVTTALVGLPGLLALTGRSTADLASRSITIWRGFQSDDS